MMVITKKSEQEDDMAAYWTFGIAWFAIAGSTILFSCFIQNKKG